MNNTGLDDATMIATAQRRRAKLGACPDVTHPLTCRCHVGTFPFAGEERPGPRRSTGSDEHVIEAAPLPREKSVQQDVREEYEAAGCKVYNLSQARAAKQTPGLSDLWIVHVGRGVAFWHEVKRPGGELSDAQRTFREECRACGVRHVSGGVEEARIAIQRWGLTPLTPTPPGSTP